MGNTCNWDGRCGESEHGKSRNQARLFILSYLLFGRMHVDIDILRRQIEAQEDERVCVFGEVRLVHTLNALLEHTAVYQSLCPEIKQDIVLG